MCAGCAWLSLGLLSSLSLLFLFISLTLHGLAQSTGHGWPIPSLPSLPNAFGWTLPPSYHENLVPNITLEGSRPHFIQVVFYQALLPKTQSSLTHRNKSNHNETATVKLY